MSPPAATSRTRRCRSDPAIRCRSLRASVARPDIATGAVGMITDAQQAQEILDDGDADLIIMARELLRDPYFPRRAAKELGAVIEPPEQYQRAW